MGDERGARLKTIAAIFSGLRATWVVLMAAPLGLYGVVALVLVVGGHTEAELHARALALLALALTWLCGGGLLARFVHERLLEARTLGAWVEVESDARSYRAAPVRRVHISRADLSRVGRLYVWRLAIAVGFQLPVLHTVFWAGSTTSLHAIEQAFPCAHVVTLLACTLITLLQAPTLSRVLGPLHQPVMSWLEQAEPSRAAG